MSYVTIQRLSNIATKLTEDERTLKNINKMMIDDVWKDFGKAESPDLLKTANKLKGKIMGGMQKEIANLFAEYSK